MKFEALSESQPNKLRVLVSGADEHFLNALRRTLNAEVPTFAIDEISFYENTSPLFNEYVASRLALVPLTFEEGVAPGTQISFSLEAEAQDAARTVYSRELQSSDPVIRVFCERVPLMRLGKGQKLRLEATAVQGAARNHAKFQSALASYSAMPDFHVSSKCDKCGECVKACPVKIISPHIKLTSPEQCLLCESCVESCPKAAITVRPKPGEFVFFVESFNNLSASEQLERGLRLIGEKLEFVEEGVKNPKKLEKLEEDARVAAAEAVAAASAAQEVKVAEAAVVAQEEAAKALAAEAPAEQFDQVELVEQTAKEKKESKRRAKKDKESKARKDKEE